jgi:hypothetical protein
LGPTSHKAFVDTLIEINPFAEISDLGSSIHFTVHTAKFLECAIKVNGKQAIPKEVKTLSSSGKVSIKPMPNVRFQEIYQDYVCGCVLRIARELFALFPLDRVLINAVVDLLNTRTGQISEQPVLSVIIPRSLLASLEFAHLDPSDAIEIFQHMGDFKATRKTEAFLPIVPLTPADVAQNSFDNSNYDDFHLSMEKLRDELRIMNNTLNNRAKLIAQQTNPI